jgi:hypothetical protein
MVADGSKEQRLRSVSPCQDGVHEATQRAAADESRDGFLNVPGSGAEIEIALRLKAQVELPHVVDGGENGKARQVTVSKLSTRQPGEPPMPDRKPQQLLGYGGDVCAMIEEGMPLTISGRSRLATQLPPERCW